MTGATRGRSSKVVAKTASTAIAAVAKRSSTTSSTTTVAASASGAKVTKGKKVVAKQEESPEPVAKKAKVSKKTSSSTSASTNTTKEATSSTKVTSTTTAVPSSGIGKWLMKSEPSEYSIDHLQTANTGQWDGVRNYQARNFMQNMQIGDLAYFYHSNCDIPGIYGLMRIHRLAFPDTTAEDSKSKYYDAKVKSSGKNPWCCVGVEFVEKYSKPLTLQDIKTLSLGDCRLIAKGNRLSLFPLTEEQYDLLGQEVHKRNQ